MMWENRARSTSINQKNYGLTDYLGGKSINHRREDYLVPPPPVGSVVSLETAWRTAIVGRRSKTFVEITFS